MPSFPFEQSLRNTIAERLDKFEVRSHPKDELRDAAVAVVIADDPKSGAAGILMTMRPPKLNRHGGQYALPGGRLDPGETDIVAARRELQEELGLTLGDGDVLGRLDHFPTRSGFRIAPVVMWCEDTAMMQPDPSEVDRVFHLPMQELDSPDIPRLQPSDNSPHPVLSAFFPTLGHYMFAPTAAILYQFREVALRGEATRAAHFDQPSFAWK